MGTKERNIRSLPEDTSLEELVPKDNFYRRLEEKLDLSFARELVEDPYAHSGRPSFDPSELLKEGEGDDLRVREALYRLVAAGAWVKQSVGVVHDTEERLEKALGEGGWLRALELDEYAARPRNKPEMLQGALFPYWKPCSPGCQRARSPRS